LAAQGIGAAPGEPFMVQPDTPSLRVTVGLIDQNIDVIAKVLADAAGTMPTRAGQR
jgi:hypothetical protein